MSRYIPALIVLFCIAYAQRRKVNIFEHFLEGAKAGIIALWHIFPTLIGMFIALSLVRNSLIWGYIISIVALAFKPLGVLRELVPLVVVRPFSGSAALAVLTKTLAEYGPDSLIGLAASTFVASTETIFYVIMTYLASVRIKKSRHIFATAIIVQIAAIVASCLVWRLLS